VENVSLSSVRVSFFILFIFSCNASLFCLVCLHSSIQGVLDSRKWRGRLLLLDDSVLFFFFFLVIYDKLFMMLGICTAVLKPQWNRKQPLFSNFFVAWKKCKFYSSRKKHS
jgi:hypothetical protein